MTVPTPRSAAAGHLDEEEPGTDEESRTRGAAVEHTQPKHSIFSPQSIWGLSHVLGRLGPMSRRRFFAMLDVFYRADPKVQALAAKFEASGPLAFVEMLCAAKDADDGGRFAFPWVGFGAAVFQGDPKPLVGLAKDVGLIEIEEETERGFTASFPSETWAKWNPKSSTERSRKHRRKQSVASRPAALHDDETRDGDALEVEGETEPETEPSIKEEGEATPIAQVLALLLEAFEQNDRKGIEPAELAVARALREFPQKDHVAVAREYVAWQMTCAPSKRHTNLITGFRNQLRRADDSDEGLPAVML